jgi:predicted Ser/Thr protein kinase
MTGDPRNDIAGDGRPKRFGSYRVEARIGAGGMGVVYLALDEALQRQVALKTLLPALAADPEFVARFKREAQSAAALNHPNITQIYTIGQEGAVPFFAMELIRGTSLEAIVKEKGTIPAKEAAGYLLQAAMGLRHAAQKKLIHRDVKPSNLMLTEDGVVKITDFGLAKAARSETQLTATGEVLGSPGYISPEQAQGADLDARSDIYSLGATFYHLVTGKLPFEAPTPVAMIVKHMSEPLRSPRAVNSAVPFPIAAAIQRMMAKRPGDRFQDYDALIRELERALSLISTDAPVPARAGASAGAPSWSGTTGVDQRARPARSPALAPAGGVETDERPGGVPWALAVPAALLGVLLVAGIVKHQRAVLARADAAPGAVAGGESASGEVPVETMTFTGRAGGDGLRQGLRAGLAGDERLRDRFRQRPRPNLTFVSNDHAVLPDGRIKVSGRVQNNGAGVAKQVRARIRILMENGDTAAEGEAALEPSVIPPQGTATFEIPLDYSGPIGTVKADLTWVE